jgi:hypothetical protein
MLTARSVSVPVLNWLLNVQRKQHLQSAITNQLKTLHPTPVLALTQQHVPSSHPCEQGPEPHHHADIQDRNVDPLNPTFRAMPFP